MQDCDPGGKVNRKGVSVIALARVSKKKKVVVFTILGIKTY